MAGGQTGVPGEAAAGPVAVEYRHARVLALIHRRQWVEQIAKDVVSSPKFATPIAVQVLYISLIIES